MEAMQKMPLERRLQSAGTVIPNFLCAFELFVDDYFDGISQMTNNSYFAEIYSGEVQQYNCYETDKVLAEIVFMAESLSPCERARLLYRLLIEPFALMEIERNERK